MSAHTEPVNENVAGSASRILLNSSACGGLLAGMTAWIVSLLWSLLPNPYLSTTETLRPLSNVQDVVIRNSDRVAPNTGMVVPRVTRYRPPAYTDHARSARVEGTVTVRATIDIDGRATPIEVVQPLGYGLDESASDAVRQWSFVPAFRSGQRVQVVADVNVHFRLEDGLFGRAVSDLEAGNLARARLLLQNVIAVSPDSFRVSAAKFGIAESLFQRGTRESLTQAARQSRPYRRRTSSWRISGVTTWGASSRIP